MSDNTRSSPTDGKPCPCKRISAALADMRLTIVLMALGIALLFFASLTSAGYSVDVAGKAYFGSLIAIWQYPAEWPVGSVLSIFWLPLPGGPLVAAAAVVNLIFAGLKMHARSPNGLAFAGLALTHVGVITVLIGYVALYAALILTGFAQATNIVIAGCTMTVAGLALLFAPELVRFMRSRVKDVPAPEASLSKRRLNRSWVFSPITGILIGILSYFVYGSVRLAHLYEDTDLELMPLILYVPALAVFCYYWVKGDNGNEVHRRMAFPLLAAAITMHTILPVCLALVRMRPPVTDLHSSLVTAGWVGALIAYYIERRRKDGIAGFAAALVGTATLLLSHFFADTNLTGVLNPAIDSTLWLALHVCTISIGYGAVLVAVVIANMKLAGSFRNAPLNRARDATGTIRAALVVGLIFCAAGTLMGGLWAERAWGRFWGWDPKENAALMLILWCALVLHARRGGLASDVGFARLSAAGGIVLACSWAGTNLLGAGLHCYGFAQGGAWLLGIYTVAQLALIVAARKVKTQN
jgi:ABC-type transport system involved in cytochrome c biogenesis permease subunit